MERFSGKHPPDTADSSPLGPIAASGKKSFVLASIGSLRPPKNQMAVLQTVKQIVKKGTIPGLKTIFVGEGYDRPNLEKFVRTEGLEEHVFFLGRRNDVDRILSMVDILISTSFPGWEGLSNVMLEAMSSRVPVVGFRSVGSSEVIIEGVTGFMLEYGDNESLQERIERLAHDPALLEAMGQHAREFVKSRFSIESMVSSYERTYCRLMEDKGY
jgi:glycosyltransferase involved in cell wall biosynthesis